jgi:hypothetical protein
VLVNIEVDNKGITTHWISAYCLSVKILWATPVSWSFTVLKYELLIEVSQVILH